MNDNFIGVKQLNTYVKTLIESDARLNFISVKGEISNFKSHFSSGHWYFTLKDADASVKCIMLSWSNKLVNFKPEDGMNVIIKGRVSLYEKDGQYQLYAEEMSLYGEGELAAKFLRLKEKLQKEGLFDADSKRQINKFPKRIAVVTSGSGAAVEDIKRVLARRYPIGEVILCAVSVQGVNAASSIISVLDRVYALNDVDTIIIGRGGGSAENLAAFNDEALVRKVYDSPFPVISAVGHETDFTLCDFVADLRAPTPSAAAELAVCDINELQFQILKYKKMITNKTEARFKLLSSEFMLLKNALSFNNPKNMLKRYGEKLLILKKQCVDNYVAHINAKTLALANSASKLDALSPLKTLARGYAVAKQGDSVIKSVDRIKINEKISVVFSDGVADCTVDSVTRKE